MKLVVAADRRREFTPRLTEIVPPRRLRYVHRTLGGLVLRADHEILIEPLDGGRRCRLRQHERFGGLALPFAWRAIRAAAGPGFERMNRDLKREAEARSRGGGA